MPRGGSRKRSDEWIAASAERRFLAAIQPGPVPERRPDLGPCLLYTGGSNGNGYGQFRYARGAGKYAHRYAWEREKGLIPEGMTVDHLCFVRNCVNISHLNLVDGVTNYLRGVEQRTHCPNGHLYPEGGTRGAYWRCWECQKAARQRSTQKQRRVENGLPDRRLCFDQSRIEQAITDIQAGRMTITDAAREIGCHQNYLGRRAWNATKKIVIARDENKCRKCGRPAEVVHHRIRRGMGSTRDPLVAYGIANCICLCNSCHGYVHSHPEESYALGFLLHTWDNPEDIPVEVRSKHEF